MRQEFDQRFDELGATRLAALVECDVDYDEPFETWTSAVQRSPNRA